MLAALRSAWATVLSVARWLAALCAIGLSASSSVAFGSPLLGDLDADGVGEYFALRPVRSVDAPVVGQVRVYSGTTRALLRSFTSREADDAFGVSACFIADLNADGVDDILIGAPRASTIGGVRTGRVYALCGVSSGVIFTVDGEVFSDFGRTVAPVGDLDADGVPDFAVAQRRVDPLGEWYGLVTLHSGVAGELIGGFWSDEGDATFGYSVESVGDLDDDGVPDLAIASPLVETGPGLRGGVRVFLSATTGFGEGRASSDADGAINNTALPSAVFGSVLTLGRDLNEDGAPELVVGATIVDPGTGMPLAATLTAYDLSTLRPVGSAMIDPASLRVDVTGDLLIDERDVIESLLSLGQAADTKNPINPDVDGDEEVTTTDLLHVLGATPGALSPVELIDPTRAPQLAVALLNILDIIRMCMGVSANDDRIRLSALDPPDLGPQTEPISPAELACCIYRLVFWLVPEDLRPPPPPGCTIDDGSGGGGGGGDDDDNNNGDDDDDGDGNDDECQFSIIGPDLLVVGQGTGVFSIVGQTNGTLTLWSFYPPINPVVQFAGSGMTGPSASFRGVRPGVAHIVATSYRNGNAQCSATKEVTVSGPCEVELSGPGSVLVGGSATVTAANVEPGAILFWSVEGPGIVTGTTQTSATVRAQGVGAMRVVASMRVNGAEICRRVLVVQSSCAGDISGPSSLPMGASATYSVSGLGANHSVDWTVTGGLSILSSSSNSVTVHAGGCLSGTVRARLRVDNEPTSCVTTREVDIVVSNAALTLNGLPEEGFVQIQPNGTALEFVLHASGVGDFEWLATSSTPGAATLTPAGSACLLRVDAPTAMEVTVRRTRCSTTTIARTLVVVGLDLAIDSNNDGVINALDEEIEESAPGHVILANTLDYDADGIPDYADGFGLIAEYEETQQITGAGFSRVILTLSDIAELPFNALRFEYDASDPSGIYISDTDFFAMPHGALRIWKKDAGQYRDPRRVQDGGDYIPSGLVSLTDLGLDASGGIVTLYLESLRPSVVEGDKSIRVELAQVGPGLDSPPQPLPFDVVRLTSTEIKILGRGKRDTDFFPMDILWPSTLQLQDDPPLPDNILAGTWVTYRVQVIDPRDGLTQIRIAGHPVSMARDGAGYISSEFICVDLDTPAESQFPDMPVIWLQDLPTVEIEYNPKGRQKQGKKFTRLDASYSVIADIVNNTIVGPLLHVPGWTPPGHVNDSGAFGKYVHAQAAHHLRDHPDFIFDLVVDPDDLRVIRYGATGGSGVGQFDVIYVKDGYRPAVNDILDRNRALGAFELKAGLNGLSPQQRAYYPAVFQESWDVVRSEWRWTTTGWQRIPPMRFNYPTMTRALGAAGALGPASTLGGLAVHAFYGKDDRDLSVHAFVNKLMLAVHAPSHALMSNFAHDGFEHLVAYFNTFSGGSSGVTLGLTMGMVRFLKAN